MQLIEVQTSAHKKSFLTFPVQLYKNEKNWVQPLNNDIENVFDPAKNKKIQDGGECIRWILKNNSGEIIGRVAAFVDKKPAFKSEVPTGGMGFFECINDKKAAFILFDACKKWLADRGQEAMDGPINFGDRNQWWGLLVDGFLPPSYGMNYNFPYYQTLFESYGFKCYFKQYIYATETRTDLSKDYDEKAAGVLANPDYTFANCVGRDLEAIAQDFCTVYNGAWASSHKNFKEMSYETALKLMNTFKPILDKRIIVFGYYKGEAISFYVNIPDINPIVKLMKGSMNWWNKLRFFYHLKTGTCTRMIGLIFGVVPAHQKKGVESATILETERLLIEKEKIQYVDTELIWIGDFNPRMMKVAKRAGDINKTYITYRKLFDENRPFERHPII